MKQNYIIVAIVTVLAFGLGAYNVWYPPAQQVAPISASSELAIRGTSDYSGVLQSTKQFPDVFVEVYKGKNLVSKVGVPDAASAPSFFETSPDKNFVAFPVGRPGGTCVAIGSPAVLDLVKFTRVELNSAGRPALPYGLEGIRRIERIEWVSPRAFEATIRLGDTRSGCTKEERVVKEVFEVMQKASQENIPMPIIEKLSPSKGPIGTVIDLVGVNFAGFEGDLDAWIENAQGEKAFLNAVEPLYPARYKEIYPGKEVIRVQITERLCKTNENYRGDPCESFMSVVPGIYRIFTAPWGKASSKVTFEVTR